MPDTPYGPEETFRRLSLKRSTASTDSSGATDTTAVEMKKQRASVAARRKQASSGGSGAMWGNTQISFATGRPRDPFFYWRQNNIPFDIWKPDQLQAIRALCHLIYLTHPVIASCIDIFSKYPLTGMELTCKDHALTEFHTDLFFNTLGYEEFLPDIGREYWTCGEAWPFGSFNDMLGVWEDDELLNADDIKVVRSPFLREPRFEMRLPETIREILEKRSPTWEYQRLISEYPEFARMPEDEHFPVSNILLKQLRFKAHSFHPRGIPILMRAFRAIMQEEMMNTATDAIADRLYTPLILARLGASATDLGTTQPWVPDEGDLSDFESALDAALAADFRVIVHHFAVQMESVFGRENMPNLTQDFERLTDTFLQCFGLSRSMLQGGSAGVTYASDALNRDLVTQLLTQYQKLIRRFTRDRMLVVAEAQEHWDYEVRGGIRYPIMEEVLEVDDETGEKRIVEQPKLLVPELNFKAMNLQDETAYRQFIETLIGAGVPISDETRLVNIPIDLDMEMERKKQEIVDRAVWQADVERQTFLTLRARGLPIPDELMKYQPMASDTQSAAETAAAVEADMQMQTDQALSDADAERQNEGEGSNVVALPRNKIRSRPVESDEQRGRMPKPASLNEMTEEEIGALPMDDLRSGKYKGGVTGGPAHIGKRRHAFASRDGAIVAVSAPSDT